MIKKYRYLFIILLEGIAVLLLEFKLIAIPCFFKRFFHIPCPACGLTRAFYAILDFKFIEALKYNILSVPIFIYLIIMNILIFIDLIKKTNYFDNLIKYTIKRYKVIIILILLSFIINIIKHFI